MFITHKKIFKKLILGLNLSLISLSIFAQGGISLGATRVIFPMDAKEESIVLINSTKKSNFLINSWIENSAGDKTQDFVVVPPLYVSEPSSENSLRIIKVKQNLPTDKETMYFLNVKSIPSLDTEKVQDNNVLQLAVISRIKIFIRPKNLELIENLEKRLELKQENGKYYLNNPTPYFMNMANIYINDKKSDNITLSPFSKYDLNQKVNHLKFQLVNDFGGLTPVQEIQ